MSTLSVIDFGTPLYYRGTVVDKEPDGSDAYATGIQERNRLAREHLSIINPNFFEDYAKFSKRTSKELKHIFDNFLADDVVIAGGSVVWNATISHLRGPASENSDIDIFVLGKVSKDRLVGIIKDILRLFFFDKDVEISHGLHVITFDCDDCRKIQVIYREDLPNVDALLNEFGYDYVKAAIVKGGKVVITPAAKECWVTRKMVLIPSFLRPSVYHKAVGKGFYMPGDFSENPTYPSYYSVTSGSYPRMNWQIPEKNIDTLVEQILKAGPWTTWNREYHNVIEPTSEMKWEPTKRKSTNEFLDTGSIYGRTPRGKVEIVQQSTNLDTQITNRYLLVSFPLEESKEMISIFDDVGKKMKVKADRRVGQTGPGYTIEGDRVKIGFKSIHVPRVMGGEWGLSLYDQEVSLDYVLRGRYLIPGSVEEKWGLIRNFLTVHCHPAKIESYLASTGKPPTMLPPLPIK